jgi:hypothetical protein
MASKKAPAVKPVTLARSAKTGRVVSKAEAAANPDTTVVEKIKKTAKPKKSARPELKIPKKMGAVADLLYETRANRLALNSEVEAMKGDETKLKNYVIENLPKSDQTGASGQVANVKVVNDSIFQASDWEKLYAWIKKTGNFQILNRALNQASIEDIYANSGKKFTGIPGMIKAQITKVSVTKVK